MENPNRLGVLEENKYLAAATHIILRIQDEDYEYDFNYRQRRQAIADAIQEAFLSYKESGGTL